jgi:hypothetical protein
VLIDGRDVDLKALLEPIRARTVHTPVQTSPLEISA